MGNLQGVKFSMVCFAITKPERVGSELNKGVGWYHGQMIVETMPVPPVWYKRKVQYGCQGRKLKATKMICKIGMVSTY